METLLLVVTGVSLVLALFLGWTAWRLSRAEHQRAMARVAALAAAAAVEPPVAARPRRAAVDEQTITWAPPRPEELPLRHAPASSVPVMGDAFLRTTSDTTSYGANNGQRLVATAAVVLLMALGAVGAWVYSTPGPASSTAASASAAAPLELISMRHVRDGDRLSVTGMVRNPASGQPVDRLSAAVLLFDQQGGYLTSGRGQIDVPHLAPGDESPFTVTVQAPAGAARYRVTFRTDERIAPHVDRRDQAPATTAGALPATAAAR